MQQDQTMEFKSFFYNFTQNYNFMYCFIYSEPCRKEKVQEVTFTFLQSLFEC